MSNSDKEDLDNEYTPGPAQIVKRQPQLQAGFGLVFSESMAQRISEFVEDPLFKDLKKVYVLQAKTRAARQALSSAQNIEWLMFYKGVAAASQLFFNDLIQVKEAYNKANSDPDPEAKKHKK